jgi:hypothetical protein
MDYAALRARLHWSQYGVELYSHKFWNRALVPHGDAHCHKGWVLATAAGARNDTPIVW